MMYVMKGKPKLWSKTVSATGVLYLVWIFNIGCHPRPLTEIFCKGQLLLTKYFSSCKFQKCLFSSGFYESHTNMQVSWFWYKKQIYRRIFLNSSYFRIGGGTNLETLKMTPFLGMKIPSTHYIWYRRS